MTRKYIMGLLFAAAFVGLGLLSTADEVAAVTVAIMTPLNGAQEVPPVVTPASGAANITVDTVTGMMTGSVTFSGLTTAAQAAHIHQAPAGVNGLVIIPLIVPAVTAGMINVSVTLTAVQVAALMANELYFNIHTLTNPGGEIRGQIFFPAP